MIGENMEVVIITGLSGAGKSQGVICLEDLGYYCIDNMPPALIKGFLKLATNGSSPVEKVAFVVDIRGGDFFVDLKKCLEEIKRGGIDLKVIFLEATDEVLVRRFKETRRMHPLSRSGSVREGLRKERDLLEEIRDIADYVIDTSNMKPLKLREEIKKIFSDEEGISTFTINLLSFGYKNGMPMEADMAVSYTHLRAHETRHDLVCRLLLEKKKKKKYKINTNKKKKNNKKKKKQK